MADKTLTLLPLPDADREWRTDGPGRWLFERAQALRLRTDLATRTRWVGDALRWTSNDAVVPLDVFRDAMVVPPRGQAAARDAHVSAFLADYRRRQPATPSAEEALELRAAFGPGETVVDVLSGRRWTT